MPSFPCNQHNSFKAAEHRQKHVNLLLLDGCEEYHRTYGPDGWPRHPLVLPLKYASAAPPIGSVEAAAALDTTDSPPRNWASAYVEGGQQAADLAKQVGSCRAPTGTFFELKAPGVPRTANLNTHHESHTKDGSSEAGHLQASATTAANDAGRPLETENIPAPMSATSAHDGNVGNAVSTGTERAARPWLLPTQTKDRRAGGVLARAVNSKRTPIGAFANFDLAKAPC